jgi:hypothetical protein
MTDPDAAGGGGEYQVVVGKSTAIPLDHPVLAIARANCQDSDGQMA